MKCTKFALPWLIIGDLNIILSRHGKEGSKSFDSKEVEFVISFIEQEGLIDLGYLGHDYTCQMGNLIRIKTNNELVEL